MKPKDGEEGKEKGDGAAMEGSEGDMDAEMEDDEEEEDDDDDDQGSQGMEGDTEQQHVRLVRLGLDASTKCVSRSTQSKER